jgi:hypothetical protein
VDYDLCACGQQRARLTKKQIAALSRLRGYKIVICPCGHEIKVPRTAKDASPLGAIKGHWAHRECAQAAREKAARGPRS